ncbi:MAG: beta-galactosidase trimerization domain-containing protein [Lentisphaeria bacterium]|nr:beta-galactosidase trimerization domain-containing protein [Lentisphaeria bacterium]
MKKILGLLAFACCAYLGAGEIFTVEKAADGSFSVKHRGQVLLQNIAPVIVENGEKMPLKSDYKVLPDGTKVWNVWSEEYETKHRLEIVEFAKGSSVEISLLGEAPAWAKHSKRQLKMQMPLAQFKNAPFKGVVGVSRSGHVFKEGVFNDSLPHGLLHKAAWRFLAIDGGKNKKIIIDFDPIGPSNSSPQYPVGCIYGFARPDYQGYKLNILCGSDTRMEGGMTGAKIVINEGVADDFRKIHVLPRWHYNQHVTPLFYDSFGAEKTGKFCKHLDTARFNDQAKRGWSAGKNLRKVTGSEGVFYSQVAGQNGTLKYVLPGKGLYIFCFHMGNSNNTYNKFTLGINGREYVKNLSIPSGKIAQVNIPVWLDKPLAEIKFDGKFILSSLSIQYFISEKEDYSFHRGFWYTEGYESANAYHSADYKRPLKLDATVKIINLPVPGKETARAPKELRREIDKVDMRSPQMAWSNNIKMKTVNGVRGTLNEYHDPARMQRLIKEAKNNGINVFMISGMHGRHGFPGRLQQQAEDLKIFTEAAHKAGIKVIDHHDSTYMVNFEQGLRVMAERSGEMAVCIYDFAPTPHFCLSNEKFTRTYRNYLKNVLKVSKVDGFQIDELTYYRHGCLCFSCREAFERDTNWQLPMNEFDSRLANRKSDLWKRWFVWRKTNMTNWWIGLRRDVMDVAPDMFLSIYCTHREQLQSLPSINLPFDLIDQARGIAVFGAEVMPRNPYYNARSLMAYRKLYNMFCIGYNAPPIWVWFYTGNWDVYYFCWAVSNMLQQSAMVDGLQTARPASVPDFLKFNGSTENPAVTSAVHAAEAAILYHPDSRDFNTGIGFELAVGGFMQMFQNANIPYDIIDPRAMHNNKTLSKYKVLFVIASSCLTDADIKQIKSFAAQGGTVVISSITGLNDQWGNRRRQWGFEDVFGSSPYPHFHKLASIKYPGKADLKLSAAEKGNGYYRMLGKVNARVMMEGIDAETGSKVPLLFCKDYQKGKFYYFTTMFSAGLFAHEYQVNNKWRFEWNRELESYLLDVLKDVASPAKIWDVKAPRLVHSELYYNKEGGYIAHFLNATGTELAKGELIGGNLCKTAWPALTSDISITLRDGTVKTAYAVSPDFEGRKTIAVKQVDGKAEITLPKELLKAYTVIYIK